MRKRVRFGLTFGFTGLIILLSALIIISSSLSSKATLESHARTIMENIASYTIDKSQSYLEPARKAARLTLGLSRLDIVSSRNAQSMIAYFYEHLYLYPQFSGIYFGSAEGEFFMASRYSVLEQGGFYTKLITNHDGKRVVEKLYKSPTGHLVKRSFDPTDDYDPRQRPWFIKAKKQKRLVWTDPYVFFTSKKPGITTANPVYAKDGTFLGVIGVDIEIDELSTFLSKLNVSSHGRAFILSQKGDIIAYPELNKIKLSSDGQKARLSTIIEFDDPVAREAFLSLNLSHENLYLKTSTFTSFDYNHERYNAMFSPFLDTQWPWAIGIYMPEDDYLGPIKKNGLINIGISLMAVITAIIFGMMVARKLNAARRMAESADLAKSQFLARMSHEIRTPMNAILGAGELLAETKLDTDQQRYVSIYRNAGEHLRDLIRSVLDISKIEADKFKLNNIPFSLRTVVNNTCEVFSIEARDKGINLDCRISLGTPEHLVGDPTVLKQVMVNLLCNAIKFTPTGSVSMTVDAVGRRTGTDSPDWVTLQVKVSDTGVGIPREKLETIFERFTQADGSTSREYGGSGLGLSICRSLVTLMGGVLSVTSEPGKGSLFTFTAQLSIDENFGTALTQDDAIPTAPGKHSDKRILLVEDDERNRLLFTLFLKDIPYTLDTAVNGEEALSKHFSQQYDLILMDIEMPGMDGYETTRRIRDREKRTDSAAVPIVAVTAHVISEVKELSHRAGCTDYLSKPVAKETLRQTVARYLGAKKTM